MGSSLRVAPLFLLFISTFSLAWAKELKTVKVGILEALYSVDSTSSERYTKAFEAAVFYAVGEAEQKLNSCGYRYKITRSYFEASDKSSAKKAAKLLEDESAWAVFGPRRSEDVLMSLTELKTTPLISPMANSYLIFKTKQPFFTMYSDQEFFSSHAIKALKKERYGKTYGAVIDATSLSAQDFETSFDSNAQKEGFKKSFSISVSGEDPDLSEVIKQLTANAVDFLLLPNNSKLSGLIIFKLQTEFPALKFFGTFGWGDNHYGFLSKAGIGEKTQGMCIRLGGRFSDMEERLKVFSLDYDWQGKTIEPNFTAFSVIHFIRTLTKDLCVHKPKTREELREKLLNLNKDHFSLHAPMSVYKLENGKLEFGYELK